MRTVLPVLSVAVVLGLAGSAFAVPLQAVRDAPIYDQQLNQIGTMPSGAVYGGDCAQQGYCYIDVPYGYDGWVAATDLAYANSGGGNTGNQTYDSAYQLGLALGAMLTGQAPPAQTPPPAAQPQAQVCFYENTNFRGEGFCATAGWSIDQLPEGWDNRISSIRVGAGLTVEVCRDAELDGVCQEFASDVKRLPSRLNDRATSLGVDG